MSPSALTALSIVVAGLLIAFALFFGLRANSQAVGYAGGDPGHPGDLGDPASVTILDTDPTLGRADAKVTLVMFEDFECPFCGRFSKETLPRLREREVQEGTLRIVWKDFPLSIHSHSAKAHEAGRCAQAGGKFWEYHDVLFENQHSLGVSDLKRYARDIGLSGEQFDACLDSDAGAPLVRASQAEGFAAGVSGTPSFVINGRLVSGALPYETFASTIAATVN